MQELDIQSMVSEVISDACERFAPLWTASPESIRAIIKCATIIEEMTSKHDIHKVEFEVSQETMNISFSIVCSELILDANDPKDREVLGLIRVADNFTMEHISEDEVGFEIMLPPIWERQY